MSGEVVKFNPAQIMQGVKDKIRATFVELIPDEQWNAMVQTEIEEFITPGTTSNNYQQSKQPSSLARIVQDELEKDLRVRLKELLAGPEWQEQWTNGKQTANDKIRQLLIDNSPEIMSKLLSSAIQQAVTQAHYQLR